MSRGRVGHALLTTAAVVCAIVLAPAAFADSNARIVRLSYVDGNVQVDRGGGVGFETAYLNQPVIQGTRVWTKDDGRAEIEFEGRSTVRLAPGTYVAVEELGMRDSGDRYSMVEVQEGTVYVNFDRHHNDEFRVTVSGREIRFTNSARIRLTVDRSSARIAIFKGSVEVPAAGRVLDGRKGETLTLDLTDPAHYGLTKEVAPEDFDDWDRERDAYDNQYASRGGGYSGYDAAYSYGISDLNYWGGYSYIPGYGTLWQPYGIGPGWDPFMDGAWVWYPGYGYMWVSAYPWGWMPYRYGTWIYAGNYGWCWRPATYWNTWYPVTVVQNAPVTYHQPAPPPVVAGGGGVNPAPGTKIAPKTLIIGHGPVTAFPRFGPRGNPIPGTRPVVMPAAGGTTVPAAGKAGATTTTKSGTGVVTMPAAQPRGRVVEEIGTPDRPSGFSPHTSTPGTTTSHPVTTAPSGGPAATSPAVAPVQHAPSAPAPHPAPPHTTAPPPSPKMFESRSSFGGGEHMASGGMSHTSSSGSTSSASHHH